MENTNTNSTQSTSTHYKQRIHKKEKLYFALMVAFSSLVYGGILMLWYILFGSEAGIILAFFVLGLILLPYAIIIGVPIFLSQFILTGIIKGNAIKATSKQFPFLMKRLYAQLEQLDMDDVPTVYILEGGGMLQAMALRLIGRDYIVLFSDVLAAAVKDGDEEVVAFILGHELAHIKRRHVALWKELLLFPASFIPFLPLAYSRAREYTCDAMAHYLAPKGAARGIALLTAGRHLYQKLDLVEYEESAMKDRGAATWLVEIFSTHPHPVKRLVAIQKWDRKNAPKTTPQRKTVTPKKTVG